MKSYFRGNVFKLILVGALIVFVILYALGYVKLQERFQSAPTNASVPGASNLVLEDGNGNLSSIGFPSGLIMIWRPPATAFSSTGIIIPPSGWAICDGENGTPDLRGRFVVGSTNASINKTLPTGITSKTYTSTITNSIVGGAETVELTKSQMPRHKHGVNVSQNTEQSAGSQGFPSGGFHVSFRTSDRDMKDSSAYSPTNTGTTSATPNSWSYTGMRSSRATSTNSYPRDLVYFEGGRMPADANVDAEGNGLPHENMPPYIALVYIMKL
jgi:microcystin-dependent protein